MEFKPGDQVLLSSGMNYHAETDEPISYTITSIDREGYSGTRCIYLRGEHGESVSIELEDGRKRLKKKL